jgi:hypothetical protein
MSPKVKTSTVLEETEEVKPVKNIKVMKEEAKVTDQRTIDDDEEEIEINPQKYINVICLCPYQLNLSTLPGGKGKTFTFNGGFGDTKRIMYQNLVDIMDNTPRFLEEGWYYIADKKVIRRHGLDDIYKKILTKQMIESIFDKSLSPDEAASLYKSANKSQQSIIIDLIIGKMISDSNFDMNLISAISKVSGIDLSKRAEDEKFYAKNKEVT